MLNSWTPNNCFCDPTCKTITIESTVNNSKISAKGENRFARSVDSDLTATPWEPRHEKTGLREF